MLKQAISLTIVALSFFSLNTYSNTFIKQANVDIPPLVKLNTDDLCKVAQSVVDYQSMEQSDYAWRETPLIPDEFSPERVKKTLTFICKLVKEGRGDLLTNTDFLNQHFTFYQWMPDLVKAGELATASKNKRKAEMLNAIPSDKIFLTKYYTKRLLGSDVKTAEFPVALYQLPNDEIGMSKKEAVEKKNTLTRFKYTRQQIINGILEQKNLAKPLIWLSEEGLHDVLLQGTGVLEVDGKIRYFNVHRNNGIAYDYTIGKSEQARYWYFSEVNGIKGYGHAIESKIDLMPRVSFAGNIKQLGLGKLIVVGFNDNKLRRSFMGVLADEGGAFDNNLFQLDWLVESYFGWHDYHQSNKQYPDYANAWLLIKK